ncbi:MAG: LysM peptidoglycan-binding domain-containing protein [Anaerolineaceae bacterium]|jgi:LysM repeat protein|nr:MAG: LysM peptidoglycan-binding domain-containing protein [Anaerolineaceae bacterium]
MNNRPPISSSSPGGISSFRRRRRGGSNVVYILAGVLVLGGIGLLVYWLSGPGKPLNSLFATETPTPTVTYTPTNTSTPTPAPTETSTPTITPTATFSSPFTYTVQEGDYLALLVERFNLGDDGVALILLLNPFDPENGIGIDPATQYIIPGQVILLPNPGMELPTATPIPPNLPRGTKINYTVQAGDSLGSIAADFNSTIDDIIKENSIENPNELFVGQLLVIPVNMVTPTATRPPTSTPITPGPGTVLPTTTSTPIN